jgi:predicted DNA-binding protein
MTVDNEGAAPPRARGRPKGVETRVLHVRVPVQMHDQLEIIAFATRRTTSEAIRNMLDRYIQQHGDLIETVSKAREEGQHRLSRGEAEDFERAQLEHQEERDGIWGSDENDSPD